MLLSGLITFLLVTAVTAAPIHPPIEANTYLTIEKPLNAFSFAVGARPVPDFNDIFTDNAYMNLLLPNSPSIGISSINDVLKSLLPSFKTQHNFGTKSIVLNSDGSASAVTDFIGTFWGTANASYDYLINFPRYYDTLVSIDGEWRISNKTIVYMSACLVG